jgi:hypothetical protein
MLTTETSITTCFDWFSITRDNRQYPTDWNALHKELPRGMLNYDTGIEYLDGRIELCHSSKPAMGIHTIFSGDTIREICNQNNITSFDIFDALGMGGYSRMDIAIDIKFGSLDIPKLWEELESGHCETKVDQWIFVKGKKGQGETIYIGAPKAKKRLRIYDKKAESGAKHEWTRIELQYRHKIAKRAARELGKHTPQHEHIPKMILDFANFPNNREWVTALGTEKAGLGKAEPTESNRRDWLLNTATSALAKEMVKSGDGTDLLQRFINETITKYAHEKSLYK